MAKRAIEMSRQRRHFRVSEPKAPIRTCKRLAAFTLAEVLITLAIIGVVAALTIPTVVRNYQKHSSAVAAKKMYSEIVNALNLASVDNGSLEQCFLDTEDGLLKTTYFYNNCLKPYLKISKECVPASNSEKCWADGVTYKGDKKGYCAQRSSNADSLRDISLVLTNGATVYIWTATASKNAGYCIDTNGFKKPNKMGYDTFALYTSADKNASNVNYGTNMYGLHVKNITKETLTGVSNAACNKTTSHSYNGLDCGALMQMDGWEIKYY